MKLKDEVIGSSILGRYRVVARLGQGGMGVVYLARAEGAAGFVKPVVVKRVLPDHSGNEEIARLFVREAKILANLQHPNIVSVIDFGEEGGAYIMVLDFVRAYDVDRWLEHLKAKGERLPVQGVVYLMIKVLDALGHVHTLTHPDGTPLEIVHSDISPGNVLVDLDGQVKLLDFGIARMKGEKTRTTSSKTIRGKLGYLPIEALDGSPPNVTTDVYACAVTLYELLTGEHPFLAVDETRTIARVVSHNAPPPSELRPEIPAELDAIVLRGMSKDKAQRFSSAKEFARELRRVLNVPEDEAASALGELAKRDFPTMAAAPGMSLAELETAWRNPPPSSTQLMAAPVSPADLGHAATIAVPAKQGRGLVVALVVALVVLGAVGAGVAVFLARRPEPEGPKILLVEHNAAGGSPSGSAGETATSTAAPSSAEPPASAGPSATSAPASGARTAKPVAPSGDPLSAALAKNQGEIEACFRDKGSSAGGSDVSVRISIDREGVVQRAEVLPAEVSGTPLGQCIAGVARKTKFPAQAAPATFRIPLRARRVP
jgi:eukaryotic-like serine/threonine-protein kinase